ncbi:MAG: zinc ribbon domain-containing protein [Bacillota bacterium]|nr:zinc ribbon domain-containing protein [Bacillota bacterium]
MFCTQCGKKIAEEAIFCPNCGHALNRQTVQPTQTTMPIVYVPVYLNISLTKTEPYILRLDEQRCCLLKVGKDLHTRITAQAPDEKGKALAFLAFTRLLDAKPVNELLQDFPGSIDMPTAQIRQLAVLTYYDSDFHRHMAYDRFTLVTDTGRYRGSIDYDTDMAARRPVLQQLLGYRFTFKEIVHSFDD